MGKRGENTSIKVIIKILWSEIGGKTPEKGRRISFRKHGTYANSYGITSCRTASVV